jgi:predicted nucleic acid-binding protein
MIVYADSSALIKRVVDEVGSDAMERTLERHVFAGDVIVASSLAWIEVSRGLLRLAESVEGGVEDALDVALSGVAERPITQDVVSVARRVGPFELRTLDAIHLATAILLEVDLVVTYDDRLAHACRHNGLITASPGA